MKSSQILSLSEVISSLLLRKAEPKEKTPRRKIFLRNSEK